MILALQLRDKLTTRNISFLVFNIIGLFLFYEPLKELIGLSFHEELYSHIPLIPLVSLYFICLNRKMVSSNVTYSYQTGVPVVVAGALFYLLGRSYAIELNQNDYLSLMMFAAVTWFEGSFILFHGIRAFRKGVFPLLFLVLMIPIPTAIIEPLILLLQTGSAHAAYGILKVTGVPVFREGYVFSLSGIVVEVAEQCSGIRSSLALFITSILAGHLFLRTGWKRIVLALSVFPITIFKNGVRIVTLSLLGAYVDKTFLTDSWLHRSGGIVFFILALILLAPVLWFLSKTEKKRCHEKK